MGYFQPWAFSYLAHWACLLLRKVSLMCLVHQRPRAGMLCTLGCSNHLQVYPGNLNVSPSGPQCGWSALQSLLSSPASLSHVSIGRDYSQGFSRDTACLIRSNGIKEESFYPFYWWQQGFRWAWAQWIGLRSNLVWLDGNSVGFIIFIIHHHHSFSSFCLLPSESLPSTENGQQWTLKGDAWESPARFSRLPWMILARISWVQSAFVSIVRIQVSWIWSPQLWRADCKRLGHPWILVHVR